MLATAKRFARQIATRPQAEVRKTLPILSKSVVLIGRISQTIFSE